MAVQRTVGEGSSFTVRIRTYDADNVRTTPNSLKYRIDCDTSGEVIRDWTDLTASSDVTLRITSDDCRIVDDTNRKEVRSLSVVIDDNMETQFVPPAPFQWAVTNVATGRKVTP